MVAGKSAIDESMVTGERIPVKKQAGDEGIGATINKTGSFKFKATKVGKDTVLAQIVKLVQDAQKNSNNKFNLLPYFYPHYTTASKNRKISELPYYAPIANYAFDHVPHWKNCSGK